MTESKTEIRLNPTDEEILEEIQMHGRCNVALLATILDKHTTYVRERVRRLEEHGILVQVSSGLYDTPEQASEYHEDY